MQGLLDKLLAMDRRIIFGVVFLAVLVPLLFPIGMTPEPNQATKNLFNAIEKVSEKKQPVLLSLDFDPASKGELLPMTEAVLAHCFQRDIPVIALTFIPNGPVVAIPALEKLASKYDKTYGKDYAFMGYQANYQVVMLNMGEEIHHKTFKTDYRGRPIETLPILEGIHNYRDIGLVVCLSGTALAEYWIQYAVTRYQAPFGMGVTAVMSADLTPYLQTGQAKGMLNGLAGASEYEVLMKEADLLEKLGKASKAMDSQGSAHLIMIVFIVLGNLAFFLRRRSQT